MLNKVTLHGRFTKDPDIKNASSTTVARFTLAVDDTYSKEKRADYISCVAFGKTAETIGKYFFKGKEMVVSDGKIQTGSYTKDDGTKVYTTDVIVNGFDFCGSKDEGGSGNYNSTEVAFEELEADESDLPF